MRLIRHLAAAAFAAVACWTAAAGCSRAQEKAPPVPDRPVAGFDVGNIAPEIEGEDLDGEFFHLSDYRGKVVVIDFWGDW